MAKVFEVRVLFDTSSGNIQCSLPPDAIIALGMLEFAKVEVFKRYIGAKPEESKILTLPPGASLPKGPQ